MNNFYKVLTPAEAVELDVCAGMTLERYQELAKDDSVCDVCESNTVWRLGQCGMCFTCTTGESDASEDYEVGL